MLDDGGNSRILDILGNRNRRRIIELLRQKPCFVTEISERLTISPKAVIEHLQLMEQENILRFNLDQRRRKYYYLAHDIDVIVHIEENGLGMTSEVLDQVTSFYRSLLMLRRLIESRDNLISSLEGLEKDIEAKAQEILSRGREILQDDADLDIVFALGHYELTYEELREYTDLPERDLRLHLEGLQRKGIIIHNGTTYTLQGVYAR
jgi:Predicted transcriptional regulators